MRGRAERCWPPELACRSLVSLHRSLSRLLWSFVGLRSRCEPRLPPPCRRSRAAIHASLLPGCGICANYYCGRGYQTYCISESDLLNFRNIIMTRFESLATRQATCWSQVLMCGSRAVLVMMRDDDGGFLPALARALTTANHNPQLLLVHRLGSPKLLLLSRSTIRCLASEPPDQTAHAAVDRCQRE